MQKFAGCTCAPPLKMAGEASLEDRMLKRLWSSRKDVHKSKLHGTINAGQIAWARTGRNESKELSKKDAGAEERGSPAVRGVARTLFRADFFSFLAAKCSKLE